VYDIAAQQSGVVNLRDKSLFTGWLRKEALNSPSLSREASASLIISKSSRSDNAAEKAARRTARAGKNIFARFVRVQQREGCFKRVAFLLGSSAIEARSLISAALPR